MHQGYCYNTALQQWVQAPQKARIDTPLQLKTLTFNVLFDAWWDKPYKVHIVRPLERFQHQFKIMQQGNFDCIALNEVTPQYVQLLIQEPWVQENYYLSDIDGSSINSFGNLFLSKYPIHNLSFVRLPKLKRPIVCAEFSFAEHPLVLAVTHLSAKTNYTDRRQVQLKHLMTHLDEHFKSADKIILGDLNFHKETEQVPSSYTDVWTTLNPQQAGFTYDGSVNTMLHEMWPLGRFWGYDDKVQMRLDRIFSQSNYWIPTLIEICLNTPVYQANNRPNLIKDILSVCFDVFGINIARNPKNYLFPSDHFGLSCIFKFQAPFSP